MNAIADGDARVRFDDVHLSMRGRSIFRGLSCRFPRGKITVILGGSGAGKSTLLRSIGGLVRPQRGVITVGGVEISRLPEHDLFEVRQRIGMLFQHGALLDSMSVFDNVALPLREHTDLAESDVAAEVERRLTAVGLPGTGAMFPRELSGGMLRRAALARAIVADPEIVLCDEPFSGLDPINVRRIEKLFGTLNRQLGLTFLITSHHIPSSLRMADQIVFLLEGIAIAGTPAELRQHADARVSGFFAAELDAEAVNGDAA
jgi:phospholipid/cholesterol/gamma-HCH transport system ATP-binding protein